MDSYNLLKTRCRLCHFGGVYASPFQISILQKPNIFLLYRLNSRASIRERFTRSREPDLSDVINLQFGSVSQSMTVEEGTHIVSVLFFVSSHALPTSNMWLFCQGRRHCHPGWNPAHRLGKGFRRRQGEYCDVEMSCSKTKSISQITSIWAERDWWALFEFDHAHRRLSSVFGRAFYAFGDWGV